MGPVSSGSLLLVGKVIRPHGLEGLLRIWLYAKSGVSVLDAKAVLIRSISGESREYTVASLKRHKNVFLMGLGGLNSIDEAEKCRGADIFIKKEALMREDDEFFWHELLGLKVFLDTGEYVGKIFRIISTKSNDIYVVKKGNKEVLIPAIHEVVLQIDLENEKMTISPMEGLLDLNEV